MTEFVKFINSILWDYLLIFLLVGCGIVFTIYLGFVQIKKFPKAFKDTFSGIFKERKEGEISSFAALSVAVAAQVGTGNVAGVASAIASGGAGAIFWMWLSAFFGMATIFVEAVLAQVYRKKDGENYIGGPAFYIKGGLSDRFGHKFANFLAAFFSVSIVLALGIVGNMTQSNSISAAVSSAFGLPKLLVGVIIAILAALIFIGGIKRIANFAQLAVPFMAIIYIGCGVVVLFKFRDVLPQTISEIFKLAFTKQAAVGGAIGISVKQAIRYGVARGLFSNEAGMGSTPHAHATAVVSHPVVQGMTAMVGVFVDTFIICTFTALIILSSDAHTLGLKGAEVTQEAFAIVFGPTGRVMLAVCLSFFAFTTIIGWYYFAQNNIQYLFGDGPIRIFQIFVIIAIIYGAIEKVDFVWDLTDMFNGIMVLPNIVALIFLVPVVKKKLMEYDEKVGRW